MTSAHTECATCRAFHHFFASRPAPIIGPMGRRPVQTFGPRLPGIEGLRAIAAMSVLVYHVYSYGSPDGRPPDLGPLGGVFPKFSLGVVLFFSLSGFLLYRPFAASALRSRSRPATGRYLRN